MKAYQKFKMVNVNGTYDPKQVKEVDKPKKMSEEYVADLNKKSKETGFIYKEVKE